MGLEADGYGKGKEDFDEILWESERKEKGGAL